MCTIKLPKGVIENIDRARKQCLWRGNSAEKKGGNLVAWPVVQQPKVKGGLGILNLRLQNDALLMKQLDKFYNKMDIPWVNLIWSKYYHSKVPHMVRETGSFWWKDILRLNPLYRAITNCTIGDGTTVSFWQDHWMDSVLSVQYPRLASYARQESISVFEVMQADDLETLFILPLSQQAFDELDSLQEQLQNISYDDSCKDRWTPTWGPSYSSQRFYSYVFSQIEAHPIFKFIWKSKCTPRVKFFVWLLLVDRLNTKEMLQRRHINIEDDVDCVLCDSGAPETIDHLFFTCPFAQACWASIQLNWDDSLQLPDRLIRGKETHQLPFVMEAAAIAAWELWKLRNDKVFQRRDPTLVLWLANFKSQCLLQSLRFKEDLRSSFCFWLDAFS
jgi:hypothetical protein